MTSQKRKFTLIRQRSDWVKGRDTNLRGTPVRLNQAYSDRMAYAVEMMVREMHSDVSGQVERLFGKPVAKNSIPEEAPEIAMDASIASESRILMNKLIDKWQKRFNAFGSEWAKTMVGDVDEQSAKDLKRSTDKMSGGMNIKTDSISDRTRDIITASTEQSASLIKTVATDYTTEVKEAIMRSITDDSQSFTSLKDSIHGMLQGRYKRYRNKAKNIALDQTQKAYSNLAASRARDIGVTEYIWRHAGGSQNPRSYHKNVLNGKKFSLDEPPVIDQKTGEKGKPGDAINCRCYIEPIISFENKGG